MQLTTLLLPLAVFVSISSSCYLNVFSSTVGEFKAQHSEPKDHGGRPQTITGGKGPCSFSGNLADGCGVTIKVNHGCGNLTFVRVGTGRREVNFEA